MLLASLWSSKLFIIVDKCVLQIEAVRMANQCWALTPFEAVPRGGRVGSCGRRITEPALLPWGGGRVWWQCAAEPGGGGSRLPQLPGSLPTSRYIDPRLPTSSPPGNTLSSLGDTVRALDTGQVVEDGGQYPHWTRAHRDMWTFGGHARIKECQTHGRGGANNGTRISQGLLLWTEKVTVGQYRKGKMWHYGPCQLPKDGEVTMSQVSH